MFQSKILFVLGAGSSHEVGLPLGSELATNIASEIDVGFKDGVRQDSGSFRITQALKESIRLGSPDYVDVNPHLEVCWRIRDALPQAISIDNLLEAHAEDEKFELCGKLGIVECILNSERNCDLNFSQRNGEKIFDLVKISKTWFGEFFKILAEGVARAVGPRFCESGFLSPMASAC